jgi:PAS domain-containing protein
MAMLSAVLSEAFIRVGDLHALQERSQELQQETRTREAEAAIRVKIAEMDEPEHLFRVVREISSQLTRLDTLHDACSIQVISDDQTGYLSCCLGATRRDRRHFVEGIANRSRTHPLYLIKNHPWVTEDHPWVLEVFRTGKPHYQPHTRGDSPVPSGLSLVDVSFSYGTLAINRQEPNAFTVGDIDLLQRFAAILSDGFQRFLDIVERLQVARCREVVTRVREEVWRMVDEHDLRKVLDTVGDGLRQASIAYRDCDINLVEARGDEWTVRHYNPSLHSWIEFPEDSVARVLQLWREGAVAYRRDLDKEHAHGDAEQVERVYQHRVRSVVDVPFANGTFAVNSDHPDAFSEGDIEIIQEIVLVLSEGIGRMRDLSALRENEALYRAVAEDAPVLICRFLPSGEVTYVNDAYCQFFRRPRKELVGTSSSGAEARPGAGHGVDDRLGPGGRRHSTVELRPSAEKASSHI